jgi:hypothetical protein
MGFKMFAKAQIGRKLKVLRSDNGGKLTSKEFEEFLKVHGIHHLIIPNKMEYQSNKLNNCEGCT